MRKYLCLRCKQYKPEVEFHPNLRPNRNRKVQSWCKICHSEYAKIYNQNSIVKVRNRENARKPANRLRKASYQRKMRAQNPNHHRSLHLKRTFGITFEDYTRILITQNNACAICGVFLENTGRQVFDVDHDHKTGKIRGLLCRKCNTDLAVLENGKWNEQAQRYLSKSIFRHLDSA